MHLSTRFPAHDRGDRTRQHILKLISEDPTITVPNIAHKLNIHVATVHRQKLNLRIAGLLGLGLFLFLYPLSAIANEVKDVSQTVVAVDVDNVDETIETEIEEAIEDDGDTAEIEA